MMGAAARQGDGQRRRNLFVAAAVLLFALTFVFAPGDEGMLWMMWRDAPALAVVLLVGALVCAVLAWRTPRS